MDCGAVIARHSKVALQFSGGKDSLAVLYLLRPFWDKLTVYYLNSGDALTETLFTVSKIAKMVPNFEYLEGNVLSVRAAYGYPTEADKESCCYLSIMQPLQAAMVRDKITLIIRGQKDADKFKGKFKSGAVVGEFELLYPLEDWSDEDVFAYLKEIQVQLPQYYEEGCTSAPDCRMCTAWREHKGQEYVMRHYPELAPKLRELMHGH